MSIVFSESTNKTGICELIDANVGTNTTSYPVAEKTRDINLALDKVFALIFQVGGTWQFDDSNQTDYPIITTNIVSGQRDYPFSTDSAGNIILEIYRVFATNSAGVSYEIFPVDVEQGQAPKSYTDNLNVGGQPITYDKLANGIFLDPIPNYNYTNGLKLYINREASYFTSSDTTKKPGFAGLFHEYLAIRPSYFYAARKGMQTAAVFQEQMLRMEADIQDYYKGREKDTQKIIQGVRRSSR